MRIRSKQTPTAAEPTTAGTLAARHAEAKIEAERLTSEAESFAGTVQERLREIDGKHALDDDLLGPLVDHDYAGQVRALDAR